MSSMSFEEASAALSEAANAPEPGSGVPAPATSDPAPSTPEVDAGTTEPDSFTNIDPNSLPPELQGQYRSMQADYTRKAQEAAAIRKQFEGLDPDRARQSVEFINALETDPNFVLTVHGQLTEALQAAGYTPAQAHAAATEALDPSAESLGAEDEYEDPATSQLAKELGELKQWKEQQEAQQYEQNLAAHLQRQEMGIRSADPTLTEPEIDRIYELAFAHGGDLTRAYNAYQGWKNDTISSYLAAKTETPTVGAVDSTGYSGEPTRRFETLDDAHKAASQHLRELMANS